MKINKSYISLTITAIVIVSFIVAIFRNQEKEQESHISGGIIRLGINSFGSSKIQNASSGVQDTKISGSGFQGANSNLQSASYGTFINTQNLNIR